MNKHYINTLLLEVTCELLGDCVCAYVHAYSSVRGCLCVYDKISSYLFPLNKCVWLCMYIDCWLYVWISGLLEQAFLLREFIFSFSFIFVIFFFNRKLELEQRTVLIRKMKRSRIRLQVSDFRHTWRKPFFIVQKWYKIISKYKAVNKVVLKYIEKAEIVFFHFFFFFFWSSFKKKNYPVIKMFLWLK